MEPLSTGKKAFRWICVSPLTASTKKWQKAGYVIFCVAFLMTTASISVAGFSFVGHSASTNLERALFAFSMTLGNAGVFYMVIVLLCSRQRVADTFEKLSAIYKTYAKDEYFSFLARANEKSEWLWNIFLWRFLPGICINFVANGVISLVICLHTYGQLEREHLFVPFYYALPWDTNTAVGYMGEIMLCMLASVSFSFVNGSVLLFFVSICFNHQAFYERYRHKLAKLNTSETTNAKEILCDLIRLQSSTRSWFAITADVYSSIVMIEMVYSMLALSVCIILVEMQLEHVDSEVFIILLVSFTAMFNLFMFCLFGKLATDGYEKMGDCLYESNWRKLPIQMQDFLVLMIGNSQRRIYYRGFGFITLDLETFSKFIKMVFSYYMMFRTLTSN